MGQAIIVAIIAIIIVAMLVYNYESKIRDLKEGFAKQLSLVKEAHASQLAALKEMNKEQVKSQMELIREQMQNFFKDQPFSWSLQFGIRLNMGK